MASAGLEEDLQFRPQPARGILLLIQPAHPKHANLGPTEASHEEARKLVHTRPTTRHVSLPHCVANELGSVGALPAYSASNSMEVPPNSAASRSPKGTANDSTINGKPPKLRLDRLELRSGQNGLDPCPSKLLDLL